MKAFILFLSLISFAKDVPFIEYQSIQKIKKEIDNYFPLRSATILGIGRSLTPLIAYLQIEDYDAHNVPLSSFRYGTKESRDLSIEETCKLFNHFDLYIPKSKKPFLVLDYVCSGESLVSIKKYLEMYRPNVKFYAVGLGGIKKREYQDYKLIPIPLSLFNTKLVIQSFDLLSEFGSFNLLHDPVEMRVPRKQYLQLDQNLRNQKKCHYKRLQYSHEIIQEILNNILFPTIQ